MPHAITTITTPFILHITVNCYLVRAGDGFILIDTAKAGQRRTIEAALERAGCRPGNLKLIILTHGDFDHCGNAAYLRKKFGTRVAMHHDDTGMVERGDMLWNRKPPGVVARTLMTSLFRLDESDRFKPDFYVRADDDFSDYGFEARVVELPGHSKGNIGLLTHDGDLFCGDLLANTGKPDLWTIMDDVPTAQASVEKLKALEIATVYPGHGKSFPMAQFIANYSTNGKGA